jgi:hypothetical protein
LRTIHPHVLPRCRVTCCELGRQSGAPCCLRWSRRVDGCQVARDAGGGAVAGCAHRQSVGWRRGCRVGYVREVGTSHPRGCWWPSQRGRGRGRQRWGSASPTCWTRLALRRMVMSAIPATLRRLAPCQRLRALCRTRHPYVASLQLPSICNSLMGSGSDWRRLCKRLRNNTVWRCHGPISPAR